MDTYSLWILALYFMAIDIFANNLNININLYELWVCMHGLHLRVLLNQELFQ
jgi:hypothetical protein